MYRSALPLLQLANLSWSITPKLHYQTKGFQPRIIGISQAQFELIFAKKISIDFSDIPMSDIFQFASPHSRRAHWFQLARACCNTMLRTVSSFALICFPPKSLMHPLLQLKSLSSHCCCPCALNVHYCHYILPKMLLTAHIHILLYVFPFRDFEISK